jgi:hypothetical protein
MPATRLLSASAPLTTVSIDRLGLSVKSRKALRDIGVNSISDLINIVRIARIGTSSGKDCCDEINSAFQALLRATYGVDWSAYYDLLARGIALPILPRRDAHHIWPGDQFVEEFSKVVREVVRLQFGARHCLVVHHRTLKSFDRQWTLERIATDLGVTRERIRALEKRIVLILRQSFLDQDYRRCHFWIRPEFSQPLRDLVSALRVHQRDAQIDAVGWATAVHKVWNVDVHEMANQEPLILQIVGLRIRR